MVPAEATAMGTPLSSTMRYLSIAESRLAFAWR